MKKYVAIAPEGEYFDITPGKEYPINIIESEELHPDTGKYFEVLDDVEDKIHCNEFKSHHLNGKNWTIKEVKKPKTYDS